MQNDMRDRLVDLIKECHKKENDIMFGENRPLEFDEWTGIYADHLIANGVTISPLTVGDMVDKWFSHNETVAIWHDKKGENCHCLLWKGMGWDIPNEFKKLCFIKFFGTIPESIMDADTINIEVAPYIKPAYEQKLKELSEND